MCLCIISSWYPLPANGIPSIVESNEVNHSRIRRNLAHAFSEKALRAQEPLLVSYADLLIQELSEQAKRGLPVVITRWYNFATFDIIADLCFGEPLYCLKNNDYHVWVNLIFGSLKAVPLKTERPDFFTYILKNQEKTDRALTKGEMDANAVVMMVAGSETTATTLTFNSTSQITLDAVGDLLYLLAVLQEGLRYYPPVATGFPRIVPGAGQEISGHFISGGTAVERNFANPQTFALEWWLEHERPMMYENDKRETLQPFLFGPRNCLGKNLAYSELRLILTKMLFHFDFEFVQEDKTWMSDQLVFGLWEKPPLNVKLTPVQR
ncbi:cytochrome P450 [Plenodomus tracheiphilus IPT5]|uniref:Cytochrome P450 n=1 Tax=Plenodomus tracheiphilus IPT5 TaxID=1408161 RepID=A0A6A7AM00_9PLEO|nr:cytochrome P450 [Plenodomus tracheiphilus IPT5]